MDYMHYYVQTVVLYLGTLLTRMKSLLTDNKLMASKRSYCNNLMALQTDTCL